MFLTCRHACWFRLPQPVKIPFSTPPLPFPLSLCFFFLFFSSRHHMFLFKPKHGPVMAECHGPPGLSIEPVNVNFAPRPFLWQPSCLGNNVDFAIELFK